MDFDTRAVDLFDDSDIAPAEEVFFWGRFTAENERCL
jgi:hypothetical protein